MRKLDCKKIAWNKSAALTKSHMKKCFFCQEKACKHLTSKSACWPGNLSNHCKLYSNAVVKVNIQINI